MVRYCKCSGRVESTGSLHNLETKEVWATFSCNKCNKEYKQKKRQSKGDS